MFLILFNIMEKIIALVNNFNKILCEEDSESTKISYWNSLNIQIQKYIISIKNSNINDKIVLVKSIVTTLINENNNYCLILSKNLFFSFNSSMFFCNDNEISFIYKKELLNVLNNMFANINVYYKQYNEFLYEFIITTIYENLSLFVIQNINLNNSNNLKLPVSDVTYTNVYILLCQELLLKIINYDISIYNNYITNKDVSTNLITLLKNIDFILKNNQNNDLNKTLFVKIKETFFKHILTNFFDKLLHSNLFNKINDHNNIIIEASLSEFIKYILEVSLNKHLFSKYDKMKNNNSICLLGVNNSYNVSISFENYNQITLFEEIITIFVNLISFETNKIDKIKSLIRGLEYFLQSNVKNVNIINLFYNTYVIICKDEMLEESSSFSQYKYLFENSLLIALLLFINDIYDIKIFDIYCKLVYGLLVKSNNNVCSWVLVLIINKILNLISKFKTTLSLDINYNKNVVLLNKYIDDYINNNIKSAVITTIEDNNSFCTNNFMFNLENSFNIDNFYNKNVLNIYNNTKYISLVKFLSNIFSNFMSINESNILCIDIIKLEQTINYLNLININLIQFEFELNIHYYLLIILTEIVEHNIIVNLNNINENTSNSLTFRFFNIICTFLKNIEEKFIIKNQNNFNNILTQFKNTYFSLIINFITILSKHYENLVIIFNDSFIIDKSLSCCICILNNYYNDAKVILLVNKIINAIANIKINSSNEVTSLLKFSSINLSIKLYTNLAIKSSDLKTFDSYFKFLINIYNKTNNISFDIRKEVLNNFLEYYKNKVLGADSSIFIFKMYEIFENSLEYIINTDNICKVIDDLLISNYRNNVNISIEHLYSLYYTTNILSILYTSTDSSEQYSEIKEKLAVLLENDRLLLVLDKIISNSLQINNNNNNNNYKDINDYNCFYLVIRGLSNIISILYSDYLINNKDILKDQKRHANNKFETISKFCDYIVGNMLDDSILKSSNYITNRIILIFFDEFFSLENNISFYILNHSEEQAINYAQNNNLDLTSVYNTTKEFIKSKNTNFINLLKGYDIRKESYNSCFNEYTLSKKALKSLIEFDLKHILMNKNLNISNLSNNNNNNNNIKNILPNKLYSDKINLSNDEEFNIHIEKANKNNNMNYYFIYIISVELFTNYNNLNENSNIIEYIFLENYSIFSNNKIALLYNYINYELLILILYQCVKNCVVKCKDILKKQNINFANDIIDNNKLSIYKTIKYCTKIIKNYIQYLDNFSKTNKFVFESSLRMMSSLEMLNFLDYSSYLNNKLLIDYLETKILNNNEIISIKLIEELVIFRQNKNTNNDDYYKCITNKELSIFIANTIKQLINYSSYKDNCYNTIIEIINNVENLDNPFMLLYVYLELNTFINNNKNNQNIKPQFLTKLGEKINKNTEIHFNALISNKDSVIYRNLYNLIKLNGIIHVYLYNKIIFPCFSNNTFCIFTIKNEVNDYSVNSILNFIINDNSSNNDFINLLEKYIMILCYNRYDLLINIINILLNKHNNRKSYLFTGKLLSILFINNFSLSFDIKTLSNKLKIVRQSKNLDINSAQLILENYNLNLDNNTLSSIEKVLVLCDNNKFINIYNAISCFNAGVIE